MHDQRTEAEVLEAMGCGETVEQAFAAMGLDRTTASGLVGVQRLQLAMIHAAIADAFAATPAGPQYGGVSRARAMAWIQAGYDSDEVAPDVSTFEGCCAGIGIDPDWLRRLILQAPAGFRVRRVNRKGGSRTSVVLTRGRRAA